MRSWIHHTKGRHVRQARVGLGDLREEHISRQGFFGPVAMIYREHGPNEIVRVEGTLHPRRVADTARVEPSDMTDPRGTPEVMLSNADVSVAVSRRTAAMPYAYRNTDGDLLYFVHQGTGQFATEFGRLAYEPGDYVLIPKGITFSAHAGRRRQPYAGRGIAGAAVADRAPAGRPPYAGRSHRPGAAGVARPALAAARRMGTARQARRRAQLHLLPQQPTGLGGMEGRSVPLQAEHPRHHSDQLRPHPCGALGLVHVPGDRLRGDQLRAAGRGGRSERRGAAVVSPQRRQRRKRVRASRRIGRRRPGMLSHTPQGILHGADEATRAAFQKRRTPGMRRTLCGVSVDTDRPLAVSAVYERLTQ